MEGFLVLVFVFVFQLVKPTGLNVSLYSPWFVGLLAQEGEKKRSGQGRPYLFCVFVAPKEFILRDTRKQGCGPP